MVSLVKTSRFYEGFFVYICNMDINDIYKVVSYMVDKYQGTYLSPDDFNLAINTAQRQYLNFLTGETAEFNQSSRRPSGGFSNDVTTGGSLTNFLKEDTLTISSQIAAQPSDFYKISAMRTTDDNYAVRRVGADKVYSYIGNAIDDPTTTDPIYTEIGTNFKFFPSTLTSAKIIYFKIPAEIRWQYTGNLVYSENTNIATTASGTNWALAASATGLSAGGYVHTTGSVVPLTNSATTATIGTYYNIVVTLSTRTVGSVTVNFGGLTGTSSANGTINITGIATTTSAISIIPSTTFDGTVTVEIRVPSTQLEWPLNDYNDIIYRTLGIIGINLKDGDLIRVSQTVKNDGQ